MLRNAALIADLRSSRQRLVAAQDEERRKIERNLHDGAQQQLVALAVQLKLARTLIDRDPTGPGRCWTGFRAPRRARSRTFATSRAGSIRRCWPTRDWPPRSTPRRARPPCRSRWRRTALGRYPREVESTLYFCALEALNNVAKYAEASSARVHLAQTDGHVSFAVTDDGRGFDPATTDTGPGMQGMADRLAALGGTLTVRPRPATARPSPARSRWDRRRHDRPDHAPRVVEPLRSSALL